MTMNTNPKIVYRDHTSEAWGRWRADCDMVYEHGLEERWRADEPLKRHEISRCPPWAYGISVISFLLGLVLGGGV